MLKILIHSEPFRAQRAKAIKLSPAQVHHTHSITNSRPHTNLATRAAPEGPRPRPGTVLAATLHQNGSGRNLGQYCHTATNDRGRDLRQYCHIAPNDRGHLRSPKTILPHCTTTTMRWKRWTEPAPGHDAKVPTHRPPLTAEACRGRARYAEVLLFR